MCPSVAKIYKLLEVYCYTQNFGKIAGFARTLKHLNTSYKNSQAALIFARKYRIQQKKFTKLQRLRTLPFKKFAKIKISTFTTSLEISCMGVLKKKKL